MKNLILSVMLLPAILASGQGPTASLTRAYEKFVKDSQLSHALSSLHVIEARSGRVVFSRNASIGLAPGSTQKVITAATAYEILGREFRYTTRFGYEGEIREGRLYGHLVVAPSGDPTLASWRWKETSDSAVIHAVAAALKRLNLFAHGGWTLDTAGWNFETVPDGWIWQDIGNFYGAGAGAFNWRENQFDVLLASGNRIGDPVRIRGLRPSYLKIPLTSHAVSAARGTGDNAYVYYPLSTSGGVVRGTIPVEEPLFEISASITQPFLLFTQLLEAKMQLRTDSALRGGEKARVHLYSHSSVPLDSIIYWFNKKSINLYGEALLRTMALRREGEASPDKAVQMVQAFWKEKGIHPSALQIVDGSGLSPLNRVTTRAQVTVLRYARDRPWFRGFYASLPELNGMRMKSGSIWGAKAFCGYHTSRSGTEYVYSFIVNNYNGPASAMVRKMYAVLDQLK